MKKLMGLLFEEEEIVEEEEIFDEPTPLPLKRDEKRPQTVQEHVQTQQTQQPVQQPKTLLSSDTKDRDGLLIPKASHIEDEPKPEAKKISMNVDDLIDVKPATKKVEPLVSQKKKSISTGYEFSPVISPMFGVDEKDAEAIISVPQKKKLGDSRIGTVISPMYGVDKTAEPDVGNIDVKKASKPTESEIKVERDMVNLTLDDILARTAALTGKNSYANDDIDDDYEDKKVINTRNMSLFDDGE